MFFLLNATPRWMVFLVDLLIVIFSLVLAYLLRFNFASIPPSEVETFPFVFPLVIGVRGSSFLLGRTYKGIIRYASSEDAQRIFVVTTLGSLFFAGTNVVTYFIDGFFILPFSIIIIEFMASTFLMISLRFAYKSIYFEMKNPKRMRTSVIIFGAGEAGLITKRTLDRDAGMKYRVLAFIDDDIKKSGHQMEGVTIYSSDRLEGFLKEGNVAHLIISVQNLSGKRKEELVDLCLKYKTKILNVPPVSSWINGELSFRQIKKIQIEELLDRNIIELDTENIKKQIFNKTVLVTGAAGSIGGEIVRQLSQYNPRKIVMVDSAESPMYEMDIEMKNNFHLRSCETIVADVRDAGSMESVFKRFKPQVVYHAAAYKHVPLMEYHPLEAVRTNVIGSKIMSDLSMKHGAESFVLVSTDKAVNPTNVMGASKRIAEMYVQSLCQGKQADCTHFITTRFGNVLGSNGSVIQFFRQQIEKGGPVTVTHPDITRYFMTIPEACQLVLEAGAMGKGGEIFLFDMGQSVRIGDLAKKMIQLAGLTLGKDIQIVYTGLRPGEKLFEELLATKENSIPTHHPQIMAGKIREVDHTIISKQVEELTRILESQDPKELVRKMKEIVPEFRSENSIFEELDKSVA